jgi:hypothetical protein
MVHRSKPESELRHRVLAAALAACLALLTVLDARAATLAVEPQPAEAQASWGSYWYRMVSPELLAQGAGALLGYGAYGLFLAPAVTPADPMTVYGYRLLGSSMAGAGAVAGTYAYDVGSGEPLNYAYFWHRGGFIVGVAAGVVAFAVLGYPGGAGTTWLSWGANRAALVGTGLLAAWGTDYWYRNNAAAPK